MSKTILEQALELTNIENGKLWGYGDETEVVIKALQERDRIAREEGARVAYEDAKDFIGGIDSEVDRYLDEQIALTTP